MSDYVPQSEDVIEAIDRARFDRLRELTPQQRLQMAVSATQALHRITVAGLRLCFPEASVEELYFRV